jgi:hypothetical protein
MPADLSAESLAKETELWWMLKIVMPLTELTDGMLSFSEVEKADYRWFADHPGEFMRIRRTINPAQAALMFCPADGVTIQKYVVPLGDLLEAALQWEQPDLVYMLRRWLAYMEHVCDEGGVGCNSSANPAAAAFHTRQHIDMISQLLDVVVKHGRRLPALPRPTHSLH